MTETEIASMDLSKDFLVEVCNAALMCDETVAACRHSLTSVAAAVIISTPEGRAEFNDKPTLNETTKALLGVFYDMAKKRGLYFYVKNEERQFASKENAPPKSNSGGPLPPN